MGELSRAIGAGTELSILGETYQVGSFDIYDWGRFQNHLVRKKRKKHVELITDLLPDLPSDLAQNKLNEAIAEAREIDDISIEELERYADTPEGAAYTIWLLIEKDYPGELTLDQVGREIFRLNEDDREQLRQLMESRDQASGMGQEGNATGLNSERKTSSGISESDQGTKRTKSSSQPGGKSSGSSPTQRKKVAEGSRRAK